jgi:arylsulfatase
LAKGGNVSLFIDGAAVGEGRVAATLPMVYSADETSDVGLKRGSPMADMMSRGNNFTGTVDGVVIETTGESIDHLISHEDVLNIIMARQ